MTEGQPSGPRNVRLDDEGEALAHAIFHAMKSDPEKKWKHASLHAKARYREAVRAVRRVLAARHETQLAEYEKARLLSRNPAPHAAAGTQYTGRTFRGSTNATLSIAQTESPK